MPCNGSDGPRQAIYEGDQPAMRNIIPDTPVTSPPQRLISCWLCWAAAGSPCTVSAAAGDHLARYAAAVKAGLLTRADLAAVVGALVVIADHVIILERAA